MITCLSILFYLKLPLRILYDAAFANSNRRPTKLWEKMYSKLKRYKEENDTSVILDKEEHAELSKSIKAQYLQYRYLKEGKPSSMFQHKIDKLSALGLEFKYVSIS